MTKFDRLPETAGNATVGLVALVASLAFPGQLLAQTAVPVANNSSNLPAPTAGGADSLATGYGAVSAGDRGAAYGEGASAEGTGSVAVGDTSFANGVVNQPTGGNPPAAVVSNTTAVGQASRAVGEGSTAVGQGSVADGAVAGDGSQSVVFGDTTAIGQGALALGQDSTALGQGAVAFGDLNVSGGVQTGYTTAVGEGAQAMGSSATAVGQGANAASDLDTAVGQASTASGVSGTVVGQAATVSDYGAAVGNFATAGTFGAALGYQAHAQTYSTATGTLADVQGYYSVGVGYSATAPSNFSVAVGQRATSSADNGVAIGSYASTSGDHSVALGADSHDQGLADVVALGNPELTRRIIDLAPGINGTDAVNLDQLQSTQTDTSNGLGLLAATTSANFGGGSAVGTTPYSGITAPTYIIQGQTYRDVGSALQGVDTTLTSLVANQGNGGGNVGSSPVQYSTAAAPTMANPGVPSNDATLIGSSGTALALHNVAAGALVAGSTDAVNGGQLAATDANVAANSSSVTALDNGAAGPVQRTSAPNRLALIAAGASASAPGAAQVLTNVAAGSIASGSTDAVNGSQIYVTNQNIAANAAAIDTLSTGVTDGTLGVVQRTATANQVAITAPGGSGAAPGAAQTLTNIAAGALAATSTDAVNGAQLYATNQNVTAATAVANTAIALSQNSVEYDSGGHGSVTLDPGGTTAQLHNLGAGTSASDAVNVAQLNSGLAGSVATSEQYTDKIRFNLQSTIKSVTRHANAGVAAAMAAQSAPFAPGKWSYSASMGYYGGQTAIGGSLRRTSDSGRWSIDAGVSSGSYGGVAIRAGVAGVLD